MRKRIIVKKNKIVCHILNYENGQYGHQPTNYEAEFNGVTLHLLQI